MPGVVVVTGGSAGVGRATVEAFAGAGWDVGILARGQERLDATAASVRQRGRRACAIAADVADAQAVERAADDIERALGPIDVWVNNAMATVFGAVSSLNAEEFRRGTEVTYLGQVHGTMAALRRMRQRDRGTIVNIGSALSYRAIPLQAVYCAAKYAARGFTDALRAEILHDGLHVHLTMVHLAAMNTPQFDWARNKTGHRAQPVPPIFAPEVAARAVLFAATHRRREVWVGFPTVKAILANKLAPGLLDHYLARNGYSGQLTPEPKPADAPDNLFDPAPGDWGAHGRFDARERGGSWELWTSRHRDGLTAALLAGAGVALGSRLVKAARTGTDRRTIRP
ncbi:MAG: SDR family oxidoreductase [Acidisphaera sp.]|nr:SDR family oxidoreductase [Acidisphaera sp.]